MLKCLLWWRVISAPEVAVLAPVAVSAPRVVVLAPEVAVSATWDVSRCHVCHVLS